MNQLKITVFKNETFEFEESKRASPEIHEGDESLDLDRSLIAHQVHKPGFKSSLQNNPYRLFRVASRPKDLSANQNKKPPRS